MLYNIFNTAQENRLITVNPAVNLKLPICKASETHRSLTERERCILIETAKEHATGALWLTMLYAGLRPEEIIPLTGADIIEGKHLRINKAAEARTGEIKSPKSKAGNRLIPISPALLAALPPAEPFAFLFPQVGDTRKAAKGKMLTATVMQRLWQDFKAAMVEKETQLINQKRITPLAESLSALVPYDLRHTYCTDLERAGVPINIASKLMGHANINITAKIYTHTRQDTIDTAAAALQAFYDGGATPTFSPTTTVRKSAKNTG